MKKLLQLLEYTFPLIINLLVLFSYFFATTQPEFISVFTLAIVMIAMLMNHRLLVKNHVGKPLKYLILLIHAGIVLLLMTAYMMYIYLQHFYKR